MEMMNVLGSDCTSAADSGWTLYFEHDSSTPITNNYFDDQYRHKLQEEYDEEEEDLSMLSDASSGPPPPHHCNLNLNVHVVDDDDDTNYNTFRNPALSTTLPKKKCHKMKQSPSCNSTNLDDTASSPAFNFSKGNSVVSNKEAAAASMELDSHLDYYYSAQPQAAAAAQFEGKSACQEDQFGLTIFNLPSNWSHNTNQFF